uniref:Alpha-1,4-N-acetylglucosaminyltransferase n=1 Tax=Daphnia galeata TaxID=27404 RepID=A0A8J2WMS2_9CRUS|nr:unnamed protein product [Daphnia galeata]
MKLALIFLSICVVISQQQYFHPRMMMGNPWMSPFAQHPMYFNNNMMARAKSQGSFDFLPSNARFLSGSSSSSIGNPLLKTVTFTITSTCTALSVTTCVAISNLSPNPIACAGRRKRFAEYNDEQGEDIGAQYPIIPSEVRIVMPTAEPTVADLESETNNNTAIITNNERLPKLNKALSIFFIETSGRSCLTARQACGIESAARANAEAIITLYMEKNLIVNLSKIDSDRREIDCDITSALEFYRTGSFNTSTTPLVHRSDIIRVALLWKNGGVYLDLDCIVMRPLDVLNNTSMILAFRWDNYLSLGPPALTEAILEFCNRNDIPASKWLHCWRNSSIFIQPADSFYAIGSGRADVVE